MKYVLRLLVVYLSTTLSFAQTNYVATTPASTTPGSDNTLVGVGAGNLNMSGASNLFIGRGTGVSNRTGTQNVFFGASAGGQNTAGQGNSFVGFGSGLGNTTGNNNTFIGSSTGYANNTGYNNAFLGSKTGYFNTTGANNTFLGTGAGYSNTTGSNNAFIGSDAGYSSTVASGNAFVGSRAGQNTTTGNDNTFLGGGSGFSNTSGGQNTYLGQNAGYLGNASGISNVFIGYGAGVNAAGTVVNNAVAIGANAIVTQSNSLVLGGTGANAVNVGIGTSAPTAKLEVVSGTSGASGLRLTNMGTTATALNQTKFLTVDAQGNVVLGSINASGRSGADEAGVWQTAGNNLQNTNAGGVIIGPGVSKTPAGYRLYVADGVLTEKVKVAVKSTEDWSDRVFEKGYSLRGLAEVEQYIIREKHLPGVASAEEVVKEGVDVGKMQAKLLEKVEELTLYVIELKKQNDALKQKSASLERRMNKLQTKTRR